MTNVPGIVPKPYPIVIFPGTFIIIIRKVVFLFVCMYGYETRASWLEDIAVLTKRHFFFD